MAHLGGQKTSCRSQFSFSTCGFQSKTKAGWQATLPPFWSGPLIFNSTNIKGLVLPLQLSCLQFYSLWANKCDFIKSIQIFGYRIYEKVTVSRMVRTQGLRQPTGHKINSNKITMKAVHKTRKVKGLRLDYLKQLIMHTSFITFLKVLTTLCVRGGDVKFLLSEFTGRCEPPDMGAGNLTQVLCKSIRCCQLLSHLHNPLENFQVRRMALCILNDPKALLPQEQARKGRSRGERRRRISGASHP